MNVEVTAMAVFMGVVRVGVVGGEVEVEVVVGWGE